MRDYECSFCGQGKSDRGRLVHGANAIICDACVRSCAKALERRPAENDRENGHAARGTECSLCGSSRRAKFAEQSAKCVCDQCVAVCLEIVDQSPVVDELGQVDARGQLESWVRWAQQAQFPRPATPNKHPLQPSIGASVEDWRDFYTATMGLVPAVPPTSSTELNGETGSRDNDVGLIVQGSSRGLISRADDVMAQYERLVHYGLIKALPAMDDERDRLFIDVGGNVVLLLSGEDVPIASAASNPS